MQDMKMTDQVAWREIGGHEIARHEIAGRENTGHEIARHVEDKRRKSSNRGYIRKQFLLLFSKHATVKCTRRDVYLLKKRQCIVVHYKQFICTQKI